LRAEWTGERGVGFKPQLKVERIYAEQGVLFNPAEEVVFIEKKLRDQGD
jgi:hypothetical protein